jgi:hypothetical protein
MVLKYFDNFLWEISQKILLSGTMHYCLPLDSGNGASDNGFKE